MVGGRLIEIKRINANEWRLWAVDRHGQGILDECCVHTTDNPSMLQLGDEIWWQSGIIFAHQDKVRLRKHGYSYTP